MTTLVSTVCILCFGCHQVPTGVVAAWSRTLFVRAELRHETIPPTIYDTAPSHVVASFVVISARCVDTRYAGNESSPHKVRRGRVG